MEVIIITLLIIIVVLLFQKAKAKKENKVIIREGNRKINSKNSTISEQSDRISELSKYQPIIDIEGELEKRRSESNAYFAVMRQDASDFVKVEREKGKRLKELAEVKLEEAHQISDKIIADAKIKAEEIAGSAYHAKNNAEQFTETARAMENIIKGYGDEYLIPGESLIDELAEDYDHTEAGKDLANIRSLIKSMIKNGMVADCDYSETKRRIAAIDFVIDAFNGKVDTVMSRVTMVRCKIKPFAAHDS
jgi:hypothetical protein